MSYNLLGKFAARRGTDAQLRRFGGLRSTAFGTPLHWLAPCVVSGCLTEFPPLLPVEDSGGTGEETTGGGQGTEATASSSSVTESNDGGPDRDGSLDGSDGAVTVPRRDGGSSADTDGVISCGSGETACGGSCVPGNSCCEVACETANAESECRDGECVITTCTADFFDCDGDYGNGCELAMPAMSAPDATEEAPFELPYFGFDGIVAEISQSDWDDVPRYGLNRACATCESDGPPQEPDGVPALANRGASPMASDLRGSFAMAWNELGLWFNVVVIDDQWVTSDEVGETGAQLHDNVMVVWDSEAGESGTGSGDDRILFAGVDGELTDWRQPSFDEAASRVVGSGQCRSIHLHLGGEYLFMGSGGSGLFEAGDRHGLNVGYNDFDLVTEDVTTSERQHLVFGFRMSFTDGSDYFAGTRALPQIELVDPP